MSTDEKLTLIAEFEKAYTPLIQCLDTLDERTRWFVPKLPDAWSIEDHCTHLLDADANMNFRVRASIAEPGARVPVWNEESWKACLAYGSTDSRACIAIAVSLRSFIAESLRALVDEEWSMFWVEHPVRGKMTLVDILSLYRDHVAVHQVYVDRNIKAAR